MQIAINGIYKLNFPRELWNDKIGYVNKIAAPKYNWIKEINGKKVKIKSRTKLVTDFYIATLIKDFNSSFYVSQTNLLDCGLATIKCNCESYNLFWMGCKCGAFQHEKELD